MSDPIKEQCERLEHLSRVREDPAKRLEVEEALRSKWEGVRSHAAKVLGIWGGRQSVEALRNALELEGSNSAGWGIRSVLIGALCKCVDPDDSPWMLEFFFSADSVSRAEYWRFVRGVPRQSLRLRIDEELRSASVSRMEAAAAALHWLGHQE